MDLSKCGGICRGACKHYAIGVECPADVTYEPREVTRVDISFSDKCKTIEKCLPESPFRDQVVKLHTEMMLEITCLKIQVRDRGNSYQAKVKENEKLRGALKEVSGCHKNHNTPKLCDGCLISIAKALEEA